MTVIVISGGLSHERDVSLRSGRRVTQALRSRGHNVVETDVGSELVTVLQSTPDPVVIPMLHGGLGEDGALREVLGILGVPFVGPTGAASRLTFDKAIATQVVANAGLSVTRQVARLRPREPGGRAPSGVDCSSTCSTPRSCCSS